MTTSKIVLAREAAEEKECAVNTIYNALKDGRLTQLRRGRLRLVVVDERYESFQPKIKHRPHQRDDN